MLHAEAGAIQQMNFTENLNQVGNTEMFFSIAEAKKKHFRFFSRNSEIVVNLFLFYFILNDTISRFKCKIV